MPPMTRPSVLRFAALLAILALLLPMAALADSCVDCLRAASSDCCPPACCPCCVQLSPALTASHGADPGLPVGSLTDVAQDRRASPDPRDVLHVPKLSLA
jgi:hypothetical protein